MDCMPGQTGESDPDDDAPAELSSAIYHELRGLARAYVGRQALT